MDDTIGRRIDRHTGLIIALIILGTIIQLSILTFSVHRRGELSERVLNRDSLRTLVGMDARIGDVILALNASEQGAEPSGTGFAQRGAQLLEQVDALVADKALAGLEETRAAVVDAHAFVDAGEAFLAAGDNEHVRRTAGLETDQTLNRLRADVSTLRRTIYARNDAIYTTEQHDQIIEVIALSCGSVFLSATCVLFVVMSGRRLRKELYLRRDRNQVLKDMAYSETTLVWEVDTERRLTTLLGSRDDPKLPKPEAFLGMEIGEMFAAHGFEFEGDDPLAIMKEKRPIRDLVYRRKLLDGSWIWRNVAGVPHWDENGKFAGYRGTAIDITAQRNYERELRQAIASFRDFATASSDNFWDIAPDGTIRWIGGEGTGPAIMRSLYLDQCLPLALEARRVKFSPGPSLSACIAEGIAFRDLEFEIDDESRTKRVWIRMSGVPHYDEAGQYDGLRLVTAVITKAKRLSLELEQKQRQLEVLLASFPVVAARRRTHADGRTEITYMSTSVEGLLGRPPEDFLGREPKVYYRERIHPEDRPGAIAVYEQAFNEGVPYAHIYRLTLPDGNVRWMSSRGTRVFDEKGDPFVESFAVDITQQVASERALREGERKLADVVSALERSRDAVIIADDHRRITYANIAMLRLVDADSVNDVLGKCAEDLCELRGTTFMEIEERCLRSLQQTGYFVTDLAIMTAKGSRRDIQMRTSSLDAGRTISILMDLTEQKRLAAEREALHQERERRERWLATVVAALDSSGDRIAIEDSSERIIYANRALRDIAGQRHSGVLGARLHDLFPYNRNGKGAYESVRRYVAERGAWRGEVEFNRPSGETVVYDARLVQTPENGILFVGTDVTDAKAREQRELELQTRLAQAEKMEALGRLAGGIAHDFNNILGAIRSFGDLLSEALDGGSRLHGYSTRIVAACDRAADLVRQILSFTRAKDAPRELVTVSDVIGEVTGMVSGRLGGATLSVSNLNPDAVVVANTGQLAQVLLNLIVNARDALPGGKGEISIGVAEVRLGKDDVLPFERGYAPREADGGFVLATEALKAEANYLRLSVMDDGAGIPTDIAQKIFDPFFTTKDKRHGSGLGLAVVSGVIAAHHGVIAVHSRPGLGTAFHIYLPAHKTGARGERAAKLQIENRPQRGNLRGKERILIVDDEVDMADAFSHSLTNLGYETAPVYSPTEALEIFTEEPNAWDLVITDQSMPEMKGLELIRRMKFLRADVKTILCTGYSDEATEESALREGADCFFTKPLDSETLALAIRRLMTRGSAHAAQ